MLLPISFLIGQNPKTSIETNDAHAINKDCQQEGEEYSERGIDVPEDSLVRRLSKGSKKNKKSKPGQYVIDIEPLQKPESDLNEIVVDSGESAINSHKQRDKKSRPKKLREVSSRSTIDGATVSGSLIVQLHTNNAPSPTSLDAIESNEVNDQGMHYNESYLETELPVSRNEGSALVVSHEVTEQSQGKKLDGEEQTMDEHGSGPPQVWISKSLSMEQGLDKLEESV